MDYLSTRFRHLFGEVKNVQRFFCPGRVNLIGEHIDYLGGLVLPMAISLGITALIVPNKSTKIHVHSTDFDETIEFNLGSLPIAKQKHWSDFILGVLLHLREQGDELSGCDVLLDSNLPKGAGLSSSAALEVLSYFMFHSVFKGKEPNRTQMALDCQKIENEFVGLNCGIMDQFAVANGKENQAIVLNCSSLDHEFVPISLADYTFLIINTNKPRTLAESAYNQRRSECGESLNIISKQRHIENLTEATLRDLELISDPILKKRTRHAITEQLRVQDSIAALSTGNLKAFGKLMNESHASLRNDYDVSCDELDFIATNLQNNSDCLGVRMTGAGFGGCCVALVNSKMVKNISKPLSETFKARFGMSPSFYDCKPSHGVHSIT
ncbi:MAG: galactokinase [Flavobacteriales bacterium]|nr:galactokinase [Flavobacteriales bacterium]